LGGITVITADHGNADDMSRTSHTLNPVPFAIVDSQYQGEYELVELPQKGLANITATLFNLMDYAKPANYEPSLIRFK
ncbi:2,3-bisphosphoglycerate-independent phosphoglycerate mutase, partial [bacterium]|nr:2,3-bisphosphoglycerate-independent phosphoglycerate mutase [bacterium]